MRYSAEHKQETRKRIVRAAARQFCRRGGKALAISDLMRELGLTHGGFYKHFDSKQQLLAEAISGFDEMEAGVVDAVSKAKPGAELKMIIEHYLRLEPCSNPGAGCPMAALSSEIARYPRPVRVEIDRAMRRRIKRLARFLPGKTGKERERNCLVLMSGMVGALNVARAAVDQKSRKAILDASKEFYIKAFFRNFHPKR
jgi:TetR/AcrR family transcriptional regulator, transcriptional repressor for nem operon